MAVAIVFLLGIGNFALHRAVIESRHPAIAAMGGAGFRWLRVTLLLEFGVLLTALLLVANDLTIWTWAYALYSAGNAIAAWLVLSGRV